MNPTKFATPRCPGTLKAGFATFSPAILRNVFDGKKVFHVLSEMPVGQDWEHAKVAGNHYGNQQWYWMKQVKNHLVPDKNGDFLLKTCIDEQSGLRFHMEQPANEHVCLQLASQVYGIETLPNTLIFFPNGQPAIICRYFPAMETFTSFETLHLQLHKRGKPIKNYHELVALADTVTAASLIVKERLFERIIFSWLVANVEGHVKNAGFVNTSRGDFIPAPLCHVMCNRMHELVPEISFVGGLFDGDKNTPEYRENGFYTRNEFTAFGSRIGLMRQRIENILDHFVAGNEKAVQLISRAFLPEEAKAVIRFNFLERISRIK